MALMRWKWVWGPLLGAVVIALLLLPPSLPVEHGFLTVLGFTYSPWYYPPGMAHRQALSDAVNLQQRRVAQARRADSILALAHSGRAVRSADGAVTVIYEPPVTADSARLWLRAALGELQLYPRAASRGLPVIVVLLSNPRRQHGPPGYAPPETPRLSGEATGGRACIVTVDLIVRPRQVGWSTAVIRMPSGDLVGRFLDVCALEAKYGQPGSAASRIASWGPNWYWRNDLLTMRLFEARRSVRKEDIGRTWEYSFFYGQVPWVTLGCLGGATDLCTQSAGIGPGGRARSDYYLAPRILLASLLANGTGEQFAAFWRSPLPADEALRRAYGRDAGELAYAALSHWYSTRPVAHGTEPRTVLAGALWAGAALALAAFAGRRRQTER